MNKRYEDFMRSSSRRGGRRAAFAFHVDGTSALAPEEMPEQRAIVG